MAAVTVFIFAFFIGTFILELALQLCELRLDISTTQNVASK